MSRIRILPDDLRNKIAAGEIVERPASVLKELLENSIDAGSRRIDVELEEGGRGLIRVIDDGSGMDGTDARLAFDRHATSKIREESDLDSIRTLGFRGEAVPSISSVSRVRMVTAVPGGGSGIEIRVEGGSLKESREAVSPAGTLFESADLFYNTPARKKFMKSSTTELAHCVRIFQQEGLAHHGIHFRLRHNGRELSDWPAAASPRDRVFQAVGLDWMDQLLEISANSDDCRVSGFVSKPPFSFSSRDHQEYFTNRRAVRAPLLSHAVSEAYENAMMRARFPAAILFIDIPPDSVDVNIHPAKREVRFRDPQRIHNLIRNAIRQSLRDSAGPVRLAGTLPREASGISFPADHGSPVAAEQAAPYLLTRQADERDAVSVQAEAMEFAAVPIGQLDRTYIVALDARELVVIDQHAAHERVLFDRLADQIETGRNERQPLLLPETVELPPAGAVRVRQWLPALKEAGIEIEEFGTGSFLIRSLPSLLGAASGRALLEDLSGEDELEVGGSAAGRPLRTVLASMACHAAVKAHQALGHEQMSALLRDLAGVKAPTCPHGRPIRLGFGISELERMFRRK